jgi:hypothetical protein
LVVAESGMAANASTSLRRWLQWRLACERQGQAAPPGDPGPLAAELATLPAAALLAEIGRQRVAAVLAPDRPWLTAQPALAPLAAGLQRLHQRDTLAALALQHLTLRVLALFQEAGLPVLVLKGIPLALQTCGSAVARGRGDLDLLVAPRQLPAAVDLLEAHGFRRPYGTFPLALDSFWGRYSRWAGYELPLCSSGPAGGEWIDLHWCLAPVRQPLPPFAELWARRVELRLQGRNLPTLGMADAFRFAAVHAAKDDWHSLRHLVDLHRLARQLPAAAHAALRRQRLVRLSAAVAHAATGGPELLALSRPVPLGLRRALALSQRAQALPAPPRPLPGPWSFRRWLAMLARRAALSPHPSDWLRVLLSFTLLPAAFNDPTTGADRGLPAMLRARWRRLGERRGPAVSGSSPASARSAPGP